jgi:cbb3-type cytochrome oxidase subunit 1
MIRSALLHLGAGFLIGALIMWDKGPGGIPAIWRWLPVHIHLVLFGWTVQLAFGVAYWILPRFVQRAAEDAQLQQVRGRDALAWASFILLNTSSIAALASILDWQWSLPISGLFIALAALAYVLHGWPRVKPFLTDNP